MSAPTPENAPTTTDLVVTVPSSELVDDLSDLPDGVELLIWAMDGPPPRERLDIVVPPYMGLGTALRRLEGADIGFVQGQSIGYEGISDSLPDGLTFANASSVHEASTAELAVGLALASQRRIPDFVRAQEQGEWMPQHAPSLADRRVLMLGYGGVGKAIAARLAGFEVEIIAVASRARVEEGVQVHGIDELAELLTQADIVMASLPGGDATRHVLDAAALALLPDDALIVNVGRGQLIDTDALAAEGGRIRAALDVTDPEPLPDDHPLWSTPGVLIAPHVGGNTTAMRPRMARLLRTQIERMLRGDAPINVVIEG